MTSRHVPAVYIEEGRIFTIAAKQCSNDDIKISDDVIRSCVSIAYGGRHLSFTHVEHTFDLATHYIAVVFRFNVLLQHDYFLNNTTMGLHSPNFEFLLFCCFISVVFNDAKYTFDLATYYIAVVFRFNVLLEYDYFLNNTTMGLHSPNFEFLLFCCFISVVFNDAK